MKEMSKRRGHSDRYEFESEEVGAENEVGLLGKDQRAVMLLPEG